MSKDPYQYFRIEARQLLEGLNKGVLELEHRMSKEGIANLLRLAHTLKGASRVVRQQEISEKSHSIEDILAPYRDAEGAISKESINHLFQIVDEIAAKIQSLETSLQSTNGSKDNQKPQMTEESFEFASIPISEMDAIFDGTAEASLNVHALRMEMVEIERKLQDTLRYFENSKASIAGSRNGTTKIEELKEVLNQFHRTLPISLEKAERELTKIRGRASDLRLLPANSIFSYLQRSVRDAAESLGKRVDFEGSGGDIRLDAHILKNMKDALLQVVRNAVAHGIEKDSERIAQGKLPTGRVRLFVERRANRVAFVCKDDGQGIDVQAIKKIAVQRGFAHASEVENLGLEEAVQILMRGGVSTSQEVSQVSGRGIGLDLVRETVLRLKGEMIVRSKKGEGTVIDMCVPVSMESLLVLTVDSEGMCFSLPFDAISKIIHVSEEDFVQSSKGRSILYEGQILPFLELARTISPENLSGRKVSTKSKSAVTTVILVQVGSHRFAVGVDRLLRIENVVMRPLPAVISNLPLLSGACFDAFGDPQPILDPSRLMERVLSTTQKVVPIEIQKKASILVIDDSLTTRMLEQSILESAGYEVALATSGEQGLEKAMEGHYALFLVDVEMPNMNGFEFIEKTLATPTLKDTPSVLVTSRASPEDRNRAVKAGARAHIVKSEFDEGHLLRTIRSLIG